MIYVPPLMIQSYVHALFAHAHSDRPCLVRGNGTDARRSGTLRARADGRSGVGALRSSSESFRARCAGDARRGDE